MDLMPRNCKLSSIILPILDPCRTAVSLTARCKSSSSVIVNRLTVTSPSKLTLLLTLTLKHQAVKEDRRRGLGVRLGLLWFFWHGLHGLRGFFGLGSGRKERRRRTEGKTLIMGAERVAFCLDLAIIFPYTLFVVGEERGI